MLGEELYKRVITTNITEELDIKLPAGIYLVTTMVDGQIKVARIVKAK